MLNHKLNSIPAILMWVMLLLPFAGTLILQSNYIWLLFPFYMFWIYRSAFYIFGSIIGFVKYKIIKHQAKWKNHNIKSLPNQLICFATYGESLTVLKRSIQSVVNQNYNLDKIYIAVSFESRKFKNEQEFLKVKKDLEQTFNKSLKNKILIYLHPNNIDGESIGAAANRSWCVKNAIKDLTLDLSKTLVTSPDADTRLGQDYLIQTAVKWSEDNFAENIFYMPAMYRFDNNFWKVPLLVRVLSEGLTMSILSSATLDSGNRYTFSCFSLCAKTFADVDFWDTSLPIDDTPFYWRPFTLFNGDFKCKSVFTEVYSNAVQSNNYLQTHIDQYHQYFRWGFGAISFSLALQSIQNAKNLTLLKKIIKIFKALEIFIFNKSITIFISLSFLLLNFYQINLANPANLASTIIFLVKLSFLFIIPTIIIKFLLMPKPTSVKQVIQAIFHLAFILPAGFVVLVLYSFLPYLHAYTKLALNYININSIKWAVKRDF